MKTKFDLRFYLITFLIEGTLVTFAFFIGSFYQKMSSDIAMRYEVFGEAYNLLKENALQDVPDSKKIEYGMIRGMLEAYEDPFTNFQEPPQNELQSNELHGSFGGIGARLERDGQQNLILYPLPESPAAKAGIMDNDRLFSVDDLSVNKDTPWDSVEAAISGPVGAAVRISIGRAPDYRPQTISVIRAEFAIPSTTWNLLPDEKRVGVIQVQMISDPTPDEIKNAIHNLQSQGAEYFILDLRDNGGGLVTAGVNTVRLFLKDGIVITEKFKNRPETSFRVDKPGAFADLPLAILVNKSTASSAEIIAGSLQAHGRAKLVGRPTFGKDSIQLVFDLKDGSSLHVTSAKWWVPGWKEPIGGKGLQPDVMVTETAENADYLHEAVKILVK